MSVAPLRATAATIAAVSAVVAGAAPGRAQSMPRQWFGDLASGGFGDAIRYVGDLDGDGFVDLAIGAPFDSTTFPSAGMVRVVSGADGSVLFTWYGDELRGNLGWLQDPIGDLDGDGHDDVLATEPGYTGGATTPVGRIFVFSGQDGSTLLQLDGTATVDFSSAVGGIGDIDGDAVPDFAARDRAGTAIRLFSGATATVIRTLTPPNTNDRFKSLVDPGDLDGDGVPDLLVTGPKKTSSSEGLCLAYSGATGSVLWSASIGSSNCFGSGYYCEVGLSLRVVGDVDGDGIADWCTGENGSGAYSSTYFAAAFCFSGKDGTKLFTMRPPSWMYLGRFEGNDFGRSLAPAGDVNGDGVPDILAGDGNSSDDPSGDVFAFSGVDGSLLFHFKGPATARGFGVGVEGGIDVDHDGAPDLMVGDPDDRSSIYTGVVSQVRVGDLVLDATPRMFEVGYDYGLQLEVNAGPPGNPVAVFLVAVNGAPTFGLLEFNVFDAFRRWSRLYSYPKVPRGVSVELRAYAIDGAGRVLASNDERVDFL
jgi:hypothetical protein